MIRIEREYSGEKTFIGCARVVDYGEVTIINPDEIVIPESHITIVFEYPLSIKVDMQFKSNGGFTRQELFRCINKSYVEIYATEHALVGDPGVPGMLNRATSKGPFGIWGHDIGDLFIEGIQPNSKTKKYDLIMGS